MRVAIAVAVVGLVAAPVARAATLKVGPNEVHTDIASAAAAAVAGDTIEIQKGRYILPATVNFTQPDLVIVGKGTVIVDGATPGGNDDNINAFNISGAGVTVKGIVFRNGDDQITSSGGTLTITKCTFIDADGSGVNVTGGNTLTVTSCTFTGINGRSLEAVADSVTVEKCKFRSVGGDGIYLTGDGAVVASNQLNFVDDAIGIRVSGDSATVEKNKLFATGGRGIELTDDNGAVEASFQVAKSNTVTMAEGSVGIFVTHTPGANASAAVEKNKIQDVSGGIFVDLDDASVISNKVTGCHAGTGVEVLSDAMTVTGNTVKLGADDSRGFYLDSRTATGGGLVEKNKANDMMDAGFTFGDSGGLFNVTVRNCSATNCGTEDEGGIHVNTAGGCTFEKVTATTIDNCGFLLEDIDNCSFLSCKVTGANGDGFRVEGGNANTFDNCSASKCGADGFDNRGTNTDLEGGKYDGDRFDISNTGTFQDPSLDGVKFVTGGNTQASEVD